MVMLLGGTLTIFSSTLDLMSHQMTPHQSWGGKPPTHGLPEPREVHEEAAGWRPATRCGQSWGWAGPLHPALTTQQPAAPCTELAPVWEGVGS